MGDTGRICYVCQKPVPFNDLGFRPHSHITCRPGTARWLKYFDALPESKQSEEGKIIAQYHRVKNQETRAKLDEWVQRKAVHEPTTITRGHRGEHRGRAKKRIQKSVRRGKKAGG